MVMFGNVPPSGTITEQDRVSIKQRQAEGVAAAKVKGMELDRPKAQKPPETVVLERASGWNCEVFRVQGREGGNKGKRPPHDA